MTLAGMILKGFQFLQQWTTWTLFITQIRGTAMERLAYARQFFSNFTPYKPSLKEV